VAEAAIPIAAAVAAAAAGAGAGALLAPKPNVPAKAITPSRDQAAGIADEAFRKRQGAAATLATGPSGAEAPSPGAKALLGQ
jgi:hypothetical protein